ncbi:MAG: sirohydrochlorin chelatase [Cyanobacterium sp. T60_A2020_053]|nr:sirohydrochlorin chelatase [Cyanobacterium sp. T60_A2020_053]
MNNSDAYILVVHGSRNRKYQDNLDQIAHLTEATLKKQGLYSKLAIFCLELSEKSLSENIIEFANSCYLQNYKRIKILPLFLFSGTHVLDDIPHEINQAQAVLSNTITLEILPHLGLNEAVIDLIEEKYQKTPKAQRVLICHGTKVKEGQQEAEKLAEKITAHLAFWSINPDVNYVVEKLISEGYQTISLLPYFLFTGKISRALEQQCQDLQLKYPHIQLNMMPVLGVTSSLAKIIVKCLTMENPLNPY